MPPSSAPSNPRSQFWSVLLIVLVTTFALSSLFKREVKRSTVGLNTPFPAIEVVGWLGDKKEGPTPQELEGNVYVVDAWAHWCGPCHTAVPHLIQIHEKYKDRGVRFVGITNEGLDAQSLEMSQKYVELLKIPYPNGFGAENLFDKLKIEGIPQLWVVDRKGLIAFHEDGWSSTSPNAIEQAIEKALAEPVPAPAKPASAPAEPTSESKQPVEKAPAEAQEAPSK